MRRSMAGFALVALAGLAGVAGWAHVRVHPMVDGTMVADGTVQMVRAGVGLAFVLSATDTEVVLVDAGMTPDAAPILEALERQGLSADAVTAIFLTHGHHDHVGGLPAFPQAKVYGFVEDAALVARRGMPDNVLFRTFMPAGPGSYAITEPLSDGQVVRFGGIAVEAFAIPGHTAGSAAYLSEGVLFLGDSATALPKEQFKGGSAIFSDDIPRNHQSLRDLAERLEPRAEQVDTLVFGHQGHLNGLQPLLDWARQDRE